MSNSQDNTIYVYVNGRYVNRDEASISIYDHGFLYGDGVYEAIRCYGKILFKLNEHLDRLYESAKSVKIDLPFSKDDMRKIVIDLIKRNGLKDAYVRIIVSRGVGKMGVDPRNCLKPTVIVVAEPRPLLFGETSVTAIIASIRRTPVWSVDPRIKTLNYMNNVLAKIEAIESGADEAIMLNEHGYVAETSTENIFLVKDNAVVTPHPSLGVLKGVTRDVVIRIAKELNVPLEERAITAHELFNADEVFVTGAAAEVVPIVRISGRVIGTGKTGPVASKISQKFRELTRNTAEGVVVD